MVGREHTSHSRGDKTNFGTYYLSTKMHEVREGSADNISDAVRDRNAIGKDGEKSPALQAVT